MFVVIVGGGRVGAQLATTLLEQDHRVRVVENRKDVLSLLHRELPTEIIYEGSGTDPFVLDRIELDRADVAAACQANDADNLAFCYLARTRYQVPTTIARINNPRNAWLFDRKFHVDVALNQAELMASLIVEEMSLGDMMTLLKLRRGQFLLVEEIIPPGAKAIGIAIKDLNLPESCVIAGIIRQGKVVVPRGVTALQEGDEVLAVTDRTGAVKLAELLNAPEPVAPARRAE
ncbi:MAG TPA: NAD-binding protein [Caldilineaceae bacterium]|nr:NAD-binding protein [Caldilineaceae bacterium]